MPDHGVGGARRARRQGGRPLTRNDVAGLGHYLASTCAFIVPGGIQQVLFPWLVAVYLMESAERVGLAQMATALPALCLILFGGALGDRVDQRKILMVVHIAAAIPPLAMAWLVETGHLSFSTLIGYALIGGVFGAFSQPARDALLNHVAGARIQRAVTLVVMLSFAVQIVGFGFAAMAQTVGPAALMLLQSLLMALGALAVVRIPPLPPRSRVEAQNPFAAIAEGVRIAMQTPEIAPAIALTFAIGVFFSGVYVVLLPLMVRDVYGGSSQEISIAFAVFMVGTVITTLVIMRVGGFARPGRAMLTAVGSGGLVLIPLAAAPPLWAFYAVLLVWGLGGGVTMAMGRSIVQEASSPTHRARIMSVYSLGMMGGMPIGSLATGFAIELVGVTKAVWLPVIGITAATILVGSMTSMWTLRSRSL